MGGTRLWATFVFGGVALASLTGCPSPNLYGTPRTTPKGKISHSLALEGFDLAGDIPVKTVNNNGTSSTVAREKYNLILPNFPTYQMRIGVADTVDIGWRIANMMTPMIDVKWNFFRSESIDLAIDPGVQWLYYAFHFHAPLVLGINVSDSVSIVPSVGAIFVAGSNTTNEAEEVIGATSGVLLRAGLGFNFRVSDSFALQPEATLEQGFNEVHTRFVSFGLGFNFGRLPKFGKAAGENKGDDEEKREKKTPRNEDTPPGVAPAPSAPPPPAASNTPPPVTPPNGAPAVVPVAPPPPAGPNGCRSVCSAGDGNLSAAEANALNQKLDPVMREVKRCLDAASAPIAPGVLLTFDSGFLRAAKIDTGGNDSECVSNAARRLPQLQSSHASIKCEYKCGN